MSATIQIDSLNYAEVSAQELAPACTTRHDPSSDQAKLLSMLEIKVRLRPDIQLDNIITSRPLIQGLLIQSRGELSPSGPCDYCARGLRVFVECRAVPGAFHGGCGNCERNAQSTRPLGQFVYVGRGDQDRDLASRLNELRAHLNQLEVNSNNGIDEIYNRMIGRTIQLENLLNHLANPSSPSKDRIAFISKIPLRSPILAHFGSNHHTQYIPN
ncbi:hypothetical protein MMC12_005200 [Toensbergia leucococca]|nr:hypothetical protein [Toensbergia leucococca]